MDATQRVLGSVHGAGDEEFDAYSGVSTATLERLLLQQVTMCMVTKRASPAMSQVDGMTVAERPAES